MSEIVDPEGLARWQKRQQKFLADEDEQVALQSDVTVPLMPGYANHALRAGCLDEWIDAMTNRFGEDY